MQPARSHYEARSMTVIPAGHGYEERTRRVPRQIETIAIATRAGNLATAPTGLGFFAALSTMFTADTLSIAVMELVDNAVMALIPGAMDAGLINQIFWLSMMLALSAAFVAAHPVNRYLLTKGKGTP